MFPNHSLPACFANSNAHHSSLTSWYSDMKYQIISTVEANNLIFNKNKSRVILLEAITTCHVNQLEDGRFILMPFDSPTSAIFDDMASCLEDTVPKSVSTQGLHLAISPSVYSGSAFFKVV